MGNYTRSTPSYGAGLTLPTLPQGPTPKLPGAFNVNVANPFASAATNAQESGDFINGLGQFLFGENNGSILGGNPLGAAVRGASAIPGVKLVSDVAGAAAGMGVGAVVGAAQHIPLGWLPGGTDDTFNSLEHTPEWQAVNEAANSDLLAGGNQKFDYVQKALEDAQGGIRESDGLATLSPGLLAGPGGSVWQFAGQLLGIVQLSQRYVERGFAGLARAGGTNRLQETMLRAQGYGSEGAFAGSAKLTPVELAVVKNYGDGTWSEGRALDFLASHGAGLSHDTTLELAGSIATDPTVIASLGSGGLARLSLKGVEVAESGFAASKALSTGERLGVAAAGFTSGDLGQAAKIARTIIDPLSAIGGKGPASAAVKDLLVDNIAVRGFHSAFGLGAHEAYRLADELGPAVSDSVKRAAAGRGSSVALELLADMRARATVAAGLGEELIARGPARGDIAQELLRNAPSNIGQLVTEQVAKTRVLEFSPEMRTTLYDGLAHAFGSDAVTWEAKLRNASLDQLNFWHNNLYGEEERLFREAAQAGAHEYAGKVPYERLNMMNETTLTNLGAKGILKQFEDAAVATAEERLAILRDAQSRYPSMKRYGDNIQFAVDDLTKQLDLGKIPAQVTAAEMKGMPKAVQEFFADHPHRTPAFRPEDGVLWNLEKNADGLYEQVGNPWVEHVSEGATYRPGFALPQNLAGQTAAQAVGRAADWLESGTRQLTKRVSSTAIRENARQRMVMTGSKFGLSEQETNKIFLALTDHLDVINKPTIRSMSAGARGDMWKAAKAVVPDVTATGMRIDHRHILAMVVDGFEGDLRYVGMTQKFTGRVKNLVARLTGYESNFAGEVSEGLYNQIRFAKNPLFQAQEAVEPFVLNGQRGISTAGRQNLSDADRTAAAIQRNLVETSVMRSGDTDLAEYAARNFWGKGVADRLAPELGRLQGIMPDIKGLKRFAQLRGIEHGLGDALRGAAKDAGLEEEYLAMKLAHAQEVGRVVSDNEYALHWLGSKMAANLDIGLDVAARPGEKLMDFAHLFDEADRHIPTHIGDMGTLGMDAMARRLGNIGEHEFQNVRELQKLLNEGKLTTDDVARALGTWDGVSPDYINRVVRDLDFSYPKFWEDATKAFKMTPDELKQMQGFVEGAARSQGMKPREFLSQIVSHRITTGVARRDATALLSNIEEGVSVLRAAKRGATPDMLAQQLSSIFWEHMHPSGREALLRSMRDELPEDIQRAMDAGETVTSQELNILAEQIGTRFKEPLTQAFTRRLLERAASGVAGSDPDLERAFQYFSKWSQEVMTNNALGKADGFLDMIRRVPTEQGVPYNATHALLLDNVMNRLRNLENDTYRMQYFARDRTVLERSINHPFFGIYPASYMWFKIMPELVRFVAKEPFGLRTGALAYTLADIEKQVAIQREFDPEFDKQIEKLGHNSALWFLAYLLPATPWDIPASAPTWLRDLSGQGLASERRAKLGLKAKGMDFWSPVSRIQDYVSPLRSAEQTNRALSDVGDMLSGTPQEQARAGGRAGALGTILPPTPQAPNVTEPVSGTDLGSVLSDTVQQLRDYFGG